MNIRVIKSRAEYEAALKLVADLMNSEAEDALELLLLVIKDYEQRVIEPIEGDAIEAIKFRMDQMAMSRKELVPYLGSLSRVSEILSGKRDLSLSMIRKLHEGLGIPLESLVIKRRALKTGRKARIKRKQKRPSSLRRKKKLFRS
jgi:HTH-type transcriptional regulator/antitoxin HigA